MCECCRDRFLRLTSSHLEKRSNDRKECLKQRTIVRRRKENYKSFWGLDGFFEQEKITRTDEKSYLEAFTDEILVKDSQP